MDSFRLAANCSGLLIEAWKITKVVDIRVRPAPGTMIGYHISFEGESD